MTKRNTKEDILTATLELAAEKGLGNVSMQQIADMVGIRKASLYNHYPSKDDIVDAMYSTIREASKKRAEVETDYERLVSEGSLESILTNAVDSYRMIVSDPQMNLFYRILMNERSVNSVASEIMVRETETMIDATKRLFEVIQKKGKAEFHDIDSAAISFAMAVHSIIDHEFDLLQIGKDSENNMMGKFIREFCHAYGKEE